MEFSISEGDPQARWMGKKKHGTSSSKMDEQGYPHLGNLHLHRRKVCISVALDTFT